MKKCNLVHTFDSRTLYQNFVLYTKSKNVNIADVIVDKRPNLPHI